MGKGGSTDLYNIAVLRRDAATGTVVLKVTIAYEDCSLPAADPCFALMVLHDTLDQARWAAKTEEARAALPHFPLGDDMDSEEVCDSAWLCATARCYLRRVTMASDGTMTVVPTHPAWTLSCVDGLAFGTTAYDGHGAVRTDVTERGPVDRTATAERVPADPADDLKGFALRQPREPEFHALTVPLALHGSKAYMAVPLAACDDTAMVGTPVVYDSFFGKGVGTVVAVEYQAGVPSFRVYGESSGVRSQCAVKYEKILGRAVLAAPPVRLPPSPLVPDEAKDVDAGLPNSA